MACAAQSKITRMSRTIFDCYETLMYQGFTIKETIEENDQLAFETFTEMYNK